MTKVDIIRKKQTNMADERQAMSLFEHKTETILKSNCYSDLVCLSLFLAPFAVLLPIMTMLQAVCCIIANC